MDFLRDFGLHNNLNSESIQIRDPLGSEGGGGVDLKSHIPLIFGPKIPYPVSVNFNWSFPSRLLPLFQNESSCDTLYVNMSMCENNHSFSHTGSRQLENGVLSAMLCTAAEYQNLS